MKCRAIDLRALVIRAATAAICLLAATAASLPAQRSSTRAPARPTLGSGADSNSAGSYYLWGLDRLEHDPVAAAAAFYWSSRLDPELAEPLYARRAALLLARTDLLVGSVFRNPALANNRDLKAIDSLEIRARARNPFLPRSLDYQLIARGLHVEYNKPRVSDPRSGDVAPPPVIARAGEQLLAEWSRIDAALRAWIAASQGRFAAAAVDYRFAARQRPKDLYLQRERAEVFYHMQQFDSVVAVTDALAAAMDTRDRKRVVFVYESKALAYYMGGHARAAAGDLEGARVSYHKALAEELSFRAAHVSLAELSLSQGDTAQALTEFDLAVQLDGSDAAVRNRFGRVLAAGQRFDDAAAHLRVAVETEPYYAAPRYALAYVLEQMGRDADASISYRAYAALAPRAQAVQARAALARADELSASPTAAVPAPR